MERNDAEAARWYRLAAEAGDPAAQTRLGLMYRSGRGVLRDLVAAYVWFDAAAATGDAEAAALRDQAAADMIPSELDAARSQAAARQAPR